MREEAVLFLKKKNQKDFSESGPGALEPQTPMSQSNRSFFASFFSKKEVSE
jgi:hypothetical protein